MKELRFDYAISKISLKEKPEGKVKDQLMSTIVYRRKEGTIGDLAKDISSGYVTATGYFSKEQFKWKGAMTRAWNYSNVIVIDVDNGSCKFDEFKNKLTYTPTLITTSSSYFEGDDDEHSLYKYHCYYVFEDKISSKKDYQRLYDQLDQQMEEDGAYDRKKGKKDRCGSSVAHLFFGNINTTMAVNADVTYRSDMFPDAPPKEEWKSDNLKWFGFYDKDLEKELKNCQDLSEFVRQHKVQIAVRRNEDENRANEWGVIEREYPDLSPLYYRGWNKKRMKWGIGSGRVNKLRRIAFSYRSWGKLTPDQIAILLANWAVQMFDPRRDEESDEYKFNGMDIYGLVKMAFKEAPSTIRERYKKDRTVHGVAISRVYLFLHPGITHQAVLGQWKRHLTEEKIGKFYNCNATDVQNAEKIGVSKRLIAEYRKRHNQSCVSKGEVTRYAVIEMTKDGWSVSSIAEILGVCPSTVYKYRKHKYVMHPNHNKIINNIYMYYPQMKDRPTPTEQEGKKTESSDNWQEHYDKNESIRTNETRLKKLGFNVSKSTIARWVKQQKENKTDNDEVE